MATIKFINVISETGLEVWVRADMISSLYEKAVK